jgi:two-component system cell cycle response regulator
MSKQIMVVDDEVQILTLMEVTLQRRGYTVFKARNAAAALAMLDSLTPDLFILDVMMPGMDGIELCKAIRTRPATAHTPVLMVSALNDPITIKRGVEAGANDYLQKPASHFDLIAKVRELLGSEQSELMHKTQ